MTATNTKISVIIVSWNTRELLAKALHSLPCDNAEPELEIFVVDNGSQDGSVEMIRTLFPDATMIENEENLGFAAANNLALQCVHGEYILLMNSDAELLPGALEAMASLLSSVQTAGLVGARILNYDRSLQTSFVDFPNLWREFLILSGLGRRVFGSWYPSHKPKQNRLPRPVDYVSGACLLLRRSAYESVGGFDDTYFMYAEEVDLCYRIWQGGWQVWYQPEAEVLHVGGGSSRSIPTKSEADLYQSRVIYFMKHHGRMSAALLAGMIVLLTTAKSIVHETLRRVSGGKYGREVVDPRTLSRKLQNVL